METNEEMIASLFHSGAIDEGIKKCMLHFPRVDFLPDSLKKDAYRDVPLPISNCQTTSAPSMIGIMLREAGLEPGMKVLEIGTGTGWQTALISCLVGKKGRVYTIDIFEEIYKSSKTLLKDFKNVDVLLGDGLEGHPKGAPYDCIIISAAASEPYPLILSQLKEGGVLIIPLRTLHLQILYKITKTKKGLEKKEVCPVLFVPMYEGGGKP